ncbi:MAG: hypothetical protein Q9220_005539 [cf. Caloplaca sp. 1 TL-2023]
MTLLTQVFGREKGLISTLEDKHQNVCLQRHTDAVVFTCTWAVQHLNVPLPPEISESGNKNNDEELHKPPAPPQAPHFLKRYLSKFKTTESVFLWRKFRWMLLTVAAPEFFLGKALAERWAAQESKRQANLEGWTTMHAFFANMRGFVFRFKVQTVKTSLVPSEPDELGRSLHELRPGPFVEGEAPYYEHNPKRAAIIEAIHCGHPGCNAKRETTESRDFGGEVLQSPRAVQQVMTEHHKEWNHPPSKLNKHQPLQLKPPKLTSVHFAPQSLSRRHTTDQLSLTTPTTLVNSPRSLAYSLALSGTSPSTPSPTSHFQPQQSSSNISPAEEASSIEPSPKEKHSNSHEHPTRETLWPLNSLQIAYAQSIGIIPRRAYIPHPPLKDPQQRRLLHRRFRPPANHRARNPNNRPQFPSTSHNTPRGQRLGFRRMCNRHIHPAVA